MSRPAPRHCGWVSGVRFDAAFSSPAERACGTMELLWGGAYQRLEGLRERSFGDLEGTDVLALPKPMGDYPVSFGGEPESKLEARLTSTLAAVMRGEAGLRAERPFVRPVDRSAQPRARPHGCDGRALRSTSAR